MQRSGLGLVRQLARPLARPLARQNLLRSTAPTAPVAQRRSLFEGYGVPQPPGNIVGTVNDAVPVPKPDAFHGSYHWDFERIIAASLVPLTVLPLATGSISPLLDATLGGLLIAHSHIGFGACITDYIPKRKFPRGHYVAYGALYTGTAIALFGLYKLETEEEGLWGAVKHTWEA